MNIFNRRFIFIVIVTLLSLVGCQNEPIESTFPMSVEIQDFKAYNQLEESVSLESLHGTIWIANFIFTNCDTVCLPMTANMKTLQDTIKDNGLENDVQLISFSIDPEHDTETVLQQYSEIYHADHSNWSFLTGYTQEEIESFANVSFKTPAAKVEGSNQFIHGTSFYLISKDGILLKDYEGVSDPPFEEIIKDIKKLK